MRFRPYIIMTVLKKGEQVTMKSIVFLNMDGPTYWHSFRIMKV